MAYGRVMDAVASSNEAGDNNCPVDKMRRNWCPSCRLRKCFQMQMNKNAVQKERGPRTDKRSKGINEYPIYKEKEQILTDAIRRLLNTALMNFVSRMDKFVILSRYWPVFFMLHYTVAPEPPPLNDLKLNELVYSAKKDDQVNNLDSEEIRLATCYALCKLGRKNGELAFATALDGTYRYWLSRHCSMFYPDSPNRDERIVNYTDLVLLHCEHISMDDEFTPCTRPANMIRAILNINKSI